MNEETELKHIAEGDARLVPASTMAQADKVLTVQADGTPGWKDAPGGGGGGEPAQYLKNASVEGDVLTLTKKDDTTVTFDKSDKAPITHITDKYAHEMQFVEKVSGVVAGYFSEEFSVDDLPKARVVVVGNIRSPTQVRIRYWYILETSYRWRYEFLTITQQTTNVIAETNRWKVAYPVLAIGDRMARVYDKNISTDEPIATVELSFPFCEDGKAKDSDKLNGKTEAQLMANIPKSSLASDVQTSLDKAETALQSHQDISGKLNKGGDTMTGILYFAKNSIKGICDSSEHHSNFCIGWWEDDFYLTSPQVGIGACKQSGLTYKLAFYRGIDTPSYLTPDGSDVLTKTLGDGYYSGKSDIKYGYNALTPSGSPLAANAVDGSINILPASASGDAFTVNLPYPTSGKVTDVIVRLDCSNLASGATLPAITWACKNGSGTAQTITWRDISGDTVEVGKVYLYCITLYPTGAAGDNTMDGMMAIRELAARA